MPQKRLNVFLDAIPQHLQASVLEGRRERQGGKLPPPLVLKLVLAMAFRADRGIPAVLRELVEILGEPKNWKGKAPEPSSITAARDRLGWEPVRTLFRAHAEEADEVEQHVWRGLRVAALDGVAFRTPDSPENEAAFGRPGGTKPAGFPVMRGLLLVDVFSHQVRAATFGPYKGTGSGELSLARDHMLGQIPTQTLLVMDRGFCAYKWLESLSTRKIPFVVRLKTGKNTVKPKTRQVLVRGKDALVDFPVPNSLRPRTGAEPLPLRKIKWIPPRAKGRRRKVVYLLTNLTDAELYPWREIAKLYRLRWEAEFTFRELKCSLTNRKVEFRSKRPARVLQEAYAMLLAYNAIRMRMAEAAAGDRPPIDLSFTDCMHAIRGAYRTGEPLSRLLPRLAGYVLPKRGPRWYPRAIKSRARPFPTKPARAA